MDQMLRASDQDREKVVGSLQDHYAQGRLDLDELEQRTRAALAAKTLGDLQALTRDLPPDPVPAQPPGAPQRDPRSLLRVLAAVAAPAALVALVLLGVGLFEIISNGVHGIAHISHDIARIIHSLSHFGPQHGMRRHFHP